MADELSDHADPNDLDFGATIKSMVPGQRVFDRYSLKKIQGRGGMGVVWLARDQDLERDVALKFLPEAVAGDLQAVDDLKRETRRSLDLTHANIVRIYDFVQDGQTAAISMEYVAGNTLTSLKLDQPNGHFEVAQLERWVAQLCDALSYAHTKAKVVHRDLKPANLMVDAEGDLKIADFGIAASVSDSVSRVSQQAGSSGTPVYMSPQQMMGEMPAVTDDVYALGSTLYELLTSRPPFYSGRVELQVMSKVAVPMTQRRVELETTGDEIPESWERTIAAMLAKEQVDRPTSIAAVKTALLENKAAPTPPAEAPAAMPPLSPPPLPEPKPKQVAKKKPSPPKAPSRQPPPKKRKPASANKPESDAGGRWSDLVIALVAVGVMAAKIAGWFGMVPDEVIGAMLFLAGWPCSFAVGLFSPRIRDAQWVVYLFALIVFTEFLGEGWGAALVAVLVFGATYAFCAFLGTVLNRAFAATARSTKSALISATIVLAGLGVVLAVTIGIPAYRDFTGYLNQALTEIEEAENSGSDQPVSTTNGNLSPAARESATPADEPAAVVNPPSTKPAELPVNRRKPLAPPLEPASVSILGNRSRISFELVKTADGSFVTRGELPFETEIPAGDYTLTARLDGWSDQVQRFRSTPGERSEIKVDFVGGDVTITSEPIGASVKRDGEIVGVTPLTLTDQPPGESVYSFELASYQPADLPVEVLPGESRTFTAELSPTHSWVEFSRVTFKSASGFSAKKLPHGLSYMAGGGTRDLIFFPDGKSKPFFGNGNGVVIGPYSKRSAVVTSNGEKIRIVCQSENAYVLSVLTKN